jgi:hypothetical protein
MLSPNCTKIKSDSVFLEADHPSNGVFPGRIMLQPHGAVKPIGDRWFLATGQGQDRPKLFQQRDEFGASLRYRSMHDEFVADGVERSHHRHFARLAGGRPRVGRCLSWPRQGRDKDGSGPWTHRNIAARYRQPSPAGGATEDAVRCGRRGTRPVRPSAHAAGGDQLNPHFS